MKTQILFSAKKKKKEKKKKQEKNINLSSAELSQRVGKLNWTWIKLYLCHSPHFGCCLRKAILCDCRYQNTPIQIY